MNGWLTLRSVARCNQKPEHCYVARIGCVSADRRRFFIGWEKVHQTVEVVDGHIVVRLILAKFTDAFDALNLSQGVFDHEMTSDFIKSSTLSQIYYECALTKEHARKFDLIDMEVVAFEVSEDGKVHNFPLRQVQQSTKTIGNATRFVG